mmetsp:Transcript_10276/g.12375  ORF Transcript_10276/g.12375 Transcript_10276/m.12375 type:complete len:234 (-) Transcript_10276:87-788(-)
MAPKTVHVEVFFDYSSPWTYLAFSQLEELKKRHADLDIKYIFKPILVGGIFNKVNPSVYEARKSKPVIPKLQYSNKDLSEWAEAYGIKILGPYEFDKSKRPNPFPVNSIKSLRGAAFAEEKGKFIEYSNLVFHSYWGESKDISKDEVMREIIEKLGLDFEQFQHFISSQQAKDFIRNNVDECISRGGFGSPTMFVNGDYMYFGNDRLPLMERRILIEAGKDVGNAGIGWVSNL